MYIYIWLNTEHTHFIYINFDYDSIHRSSVGTLFALPWYLTWFGHSLNSYRSVVRLYDYFLASPFLLPLYATVAIVLYREDDIFKEDCDMASLHCLLSQVMFTPKSLLVLCNFKKTPSLRIQCPDECFTQIVCFFSYPKICRLSIYYKMQLNCTQSIHQKRSKSKFKWWLNKSKFLFTVKFPLNQIHSANRIDITRSLNKQIFLLIKQKTATRKGNESS